MSFIWFILIGIVSGFVAGKLMRGGGFGLVVNLIVGIIGGVLGGWLFGLIGITTAGIIGSLITSVVGAIFHNVGQILVAALIMETPGLLFYVFHLMISAVVTGIITGIAGRMIVRVLRLPGAEGLG